MVDVLLSVAFVVAVSSLFPSNAMILLARLLSIDLRRRVVVDLLLASELFDAKLHVSGLGLGYAL